MPIGPAVRRLFGPFERPIANGYRAIFIDLDDWLATIRRWAPSPRRILEVGCGEGAMTERLSAAYPGAEITAIDVTPRLGRLFRGERERVRFLQAPVEEIARSRPGAFDLVILSDVLHHVPPALRDSLVGGIRGALARDGVFAFKEWVADGSLIHWACEASDRYLTGDDVAYLTAPEADDFLRVHFGAAAIGEKRLIRPWGNNMAVLVRAAA